MQNVPGTNAYLSVYELEVTQETFILWLCAQVVHAPSIGSKLNRDKLLVDKVVRLGCARLWDEPLVSSTLILLHDRQKLWISFVGSLTDNECFQDFYTTSTAFDLYRPRSRLMT